MQSACFVLGVLWECGVWDHSLRSLPESERAGTKSHRSETYSFKSDVVTRSERSKGAVSRAMTLDLCMYLDYNGCHSRIHSRNYNLAVWNFGKSSICLLASQRLPKIVAFAFIHLEILGKCYRVNFLSFFGARIFFIVLFASNPIYLHMHFNSSQFPSLHELLSPINQIHVCNRRPKYQLPRFHHLLEREFWLLQDSQKTYFN